MTISINIAKGQPPSPRQRRRVHSCGPGVCDPLRPHADAQRRALAGDGKTEADPVKRGEAAWALAEKKLAALESGVTRVARVGGPRGDAVATEVKRIAKANILGRAKAKGLDAKTVQTNFADWMAKYIAANESELRAAAEKAIAERESLAVDLDDLMDMRLTEWKARNHPLATLDGPGGDSRPVLRGMAVTARPVARGGFHGRSGVRVPGSRRARVGPSVGEIRTCPGDSHKAARDGHNADIA
jgi:hypothetical protein